MIVKLLTQHHLEFLSLKGSYRGSSESTHVKMLHCWKSHALAVFFSAIAHIPIVTYQDPKSLVICSGDLGIFFLMRQLQQKSSAFLVC